MEKIKIILFLIAGWSTTSAQNTFPTPSGNVGIGITNPSSKLHIYHTSFGVIYQTKFTGNAMEFNRSNNSTSYIDKKDNGALSFRMGSDYLTRMSILNNGNIGIGTTSPIAKLHVNSTNANSELLRLDNDGLRVTTLVNYSDGTYDNAGLQFKKWSTAGQFKFSNINGDLMTILSNGNVGIGVTSPDSKLVVDGKIRSEEVKVEIINGPDYVFESDYELRTLQETKEYITENKHLPEIPSAKEMEAEGINLGDMNMRLLKKIEELTLHLIEQNERMEKMEKELQALKN